MGCAEIISLPEVRARKQWDALRQQLHERFDQWLDGLAAQLHEPAPILAQVAETVWNLRQALTGDLSETIVEHTHQGEYMRGRVAVPSVSGSCTLVLLSGARSRPWWGWSRWSGRISIVWLAVRAGILLTRS
jgi:hypothetical protein